VIPRTVEIFGSSCFLNCRSLATTAFESPSQLKRIESCAFGNLRWPIVLPCTVLFVDDDMAISSDQLSFAESQGCDDFSGWLRVKRSGIAVDFRRILRFDSDLPTLNYYLLDDSSFEEVETISNFSRIANGISRRLCDDSPIVVKTIFLSALIEYGMIQHGIEQLINLYHRCIAAPIGFVFESEFGELKFFWIVFSK
jgi:hypothetical protein